MKKSVLKLIMMVAVLPLAISFSSCKKDPVPPATAEITVNGEKKDITITFDAEPTQENNKAVLKVKANRSWTVAGVADWFTVSKTNGESSDKEVEVEILVNGNNETDSKKSAVLEFKISDTNKVKVTVEQKGIIEIPTEGATTLYENWESGVDFETAAVNGWTEVSVKGDRQWQTRINPSKDNKYAQASAHKGAESDYEYWIISPALDITNATVKKMSFETVGAYFKETSSLKVFVMDTKDPEGVKTEISARIVLPSDLTSGSYTNWIPSGEIDLSAHSGVKYIGFQYIAKGGESNSTTYQLDNFLFGSTELPLTFGEAKLSGTFMVNTALSGAKITIPYTNAKGTETYTVSVAASGTGAAGIDAVSNKSVTLASGSGDIVLDITGTPTTEGEFTLTMSGITGLSANTVTGTVYPIPTSDEFLEDFGEIDNKDTKHKVAVYEGFRMKAPITYASSTGNMDVRTTTTVLPNAHLWLPANKPDTFTIGGLKNLNGKTLKYDITANAGNIQANLIKVKVGGVEQAVPSTNIPTQNEFITISFTIANDGTEIEFVSDASNVKGYRLDNIIIE